MTIKHTYISELKDFAGREATVAGWLYHKRSSGKIRFLVIRDGSGIMQAVLSRSDVDEETFALYDQLTQESSLFVGGVIRQDHRAPGGYEMNVRSLRVVQIADEYPISPKEHGVGFLMNHRHLWVRSSRQHAILRVRHELVRAIRDFFDDRGFILTDSPIFTPAACEGTSTLFETPYFDLGSAYLTQSGQLYVEATCQSLGKVYCFGPTFRAEKSKTRRHLTEFWMVEPEVAYADLEDLMELGEDLVEFIVRRVLERRGEELARLERDTRPLERIRKPFPRITYDEALERLKTQGVEVPWGQDFGGGDETILSKMFDQPVIITHYPKQCKAFYMKDDPDDERVYLCMDVLAPEGYGEIIGGSQREDDLEALRRKLQENDLDENEMKWYLDLRRYGSVPHSGFGLGIERTLSWICQISHVREAIPFPRMMEVLYP